MSGNYTRIALDVVADGTATDWDRLRALDDVAIDAAIATDSDSYALDEGDLLSASSPYRYEIMQAPNGEWRWRLGLTGGIILAEGAQTYQTRADLLDAIARMRAALLQGQIAA